VERGQSVYELHAETLGELEYADAYVAAQSAIVQIKEGI
jgi:hypothetical protein